MNLIQMYDRIEFYVDKMSSPRFLKDFHYDQSLNIAQDKLIQDKYDNLKQHKMYGFQVVQKIRDDLKPIVKTVTLTPVGNVLTYPPDYLYEVSLAVIIDGIEHSSQPITYNQTNIQDDNSFTEESVDYPRHIEDQSGVTVKFGVTGAFTSATLSYITIAPVITSGPKITSGVGVLTVGQLYYVFKGSVVSGGTQSEGTQFVATSANMTGSGIVVLVSAMVTSVLAVSCHEELVKYAGSLLQGTINDYNASKYLDAQANAV